MIYLFDLALFNSDTRYIFSVFICMEFIFSCIRTYLLNFIRILLSFHYSTPGTTAVSASPFFSVDLPTDFQEMTLI